jgi:hypothetical protein
MNLTERERSILKEVSLDSRVWVTWRFLDDKRSVVRFRIVVKVGERLVKVDVPLPANVVYDSGIDVAKILLDEVDKQ